MIGISKEEVAFFDLKFKTFNLDLLMQDLTEETPLEGHSYHFVNAYTISEASKSPKLKQILQEDHLLCDGMPLFMVLKLFSNRIQHIRGADLMRRVTSDRDLKVRHFFFGSTDRVLSDLIIKIREVNPEIQVVGQVAPSFIDDFQVLAKQYAKLINEKNPQVVWVGLGTPKQDYFIHELAKYVNANIFGVGAAFDFISGNIVEAPRWMRSLGLEWVFRLLVDPKRLWKRYFFGNWDFIKIVFFEFCRRF